MVHHILNDEGALRVLSPHFLEDHREDITARRGVGVVVSPPGGGLEGGSNMAHTGVQHADPCQHQGFHRHNTSLRAVHWGGLVAG